MEQTLYSIYEELKMIRMNLELLVDIKKREIDQ